MQKDEAKKRIRMMEKNLQSSYERLMRGEITQEYYNILSADVKRAIKKIKKEEGL